MHGSFLCEWEVGILSIALLTHKCSMGEEEKLVLPIGEEDLEWMAAVRGKIEAEVVKFNNDF